MSDRLSRGTRSAILAAAQEQFCAAGFQAVSLRQVAEAADVDVALISYYFGSKRELFMTALRTVQRPVRRIADALEGVRREDVARRLLEAMFETLEGAGSEAVRAVIVAAADHTEIRQLITDALEVGLRRQVAAKLGGPDAERRATRYLVLVAGVIYGRYLLQLEPVASLPAHEVLEALLPTATAVLLGPEAIPSVASDPSNPIAPHAPAPGSVPRVGAESGPTPVARDFNNVEEHGGRFRADGQVASKGPGRRGRRPGGPDTRASIAAVARRRFLDQGYAGVSLRSIAEDAGVDVALVGYYFGSKRRLFIEALAEVGQVDQRMADAISAGDLAGIPARLLTLALEVWDSEQGATMRAVASAAITFPEIRKLYVETVERGFIGQLAERLGGGDEAAKVAGMVALHSAGVVYARYLLRIEPVASRPGEELVAMMAPGLAAVLAPAASRLAS